MDAAAAQLGGALEVALQTLIGWLPAGANDREASRRAGELGVDAPPLSFYALAGAGRPALVLGYAALPAAAIREGVTQLRAALLR